MRVIILLAMFVICLQSEAQLSIGFRDNRYIYGEYEIKDRFSVKLEHSVYSEKIECQYLRGYFGYGGSIGTQFDYELAPYFGTVYNGKYYSGGVMVGVNYCMLKWLKISAMLNPHYDSGYKYTTCYMSGLSINVWKELFLVGKISNIPEYRLAEDRLYLGLSVDMGRLSVSPMLSIPIDEKTIKSARVLTSFQYTF